MKQRTRRALAYLLAFIIAVGLLPAGVYAANDEFVLTSINHSSIASAVNVSSAKDVTLQVKYGYAGSTVDLSVGLDIAYGSSYSTAVASFPGGSVAAVDGDPVNMLVTYQKSGDDAFYTTTYTVRVKRMAKVNGTFGGTITKTAAMPGSISFTASDFESKYTQNDSPALSYVVISGANPSFGSLKIDGTALGSDGKVTAANFGKLTFVPTGEGTVSYIVKAYDTDGNSAGTASLKITVTAKTADDITLNTVSGGVAAFSSSSFQSVCDKMTGETLSYVKFTLPSSTYGTLYYNYTSSSSYDSAVSASTSYYYSSDPYLSNITFAARSGYTGTVTINYTAYSTSGSSYSGKVVITVSSATAAAISYSVYNDKTVTFASSDFSSTCTTLTGETLSYVKFTLPSSTYGTLYYNYTSSSSYDSVVSSGTKYYKSSSPYIYKVTFVPSATYTGTVTINYTGYTVSGVSYSGTVKITVNDANSEIVEYETDSNKPVTFYADDFNNVCKNVTGQTLSYVKFTLPSSSYGKLYYNYTSSSVYDSAVSAGTGYYYNASSYLSKVTFVPYSGYSGAVTISYTGYTASGTSYNGTVKINVGAVSGSINYAVSKNSFIVFDESDFNDACIDATGDDLNYVKFTLPSYSYGSLYYDYTSSYSYSSAVSSGTYYYMDSSPYISKVTFVPYSSYTGAVSITYTGVSKHGYSYTGTIGINVTSSASSITYTTAKNTPVTFSASSFYNACASATGKSLSYVRFSLPSSYSGTLYYNYYSSYSYDSAVSASTSYYYGSSPYISNVSFVPYSGYTGTVSIYYTGYTTSGTSYNGTITVNVGGSASTGSDVIDYSVAAGSCVTFDDADFNAACVDETGAYLKYVRISLPTSSYGTLYYDYNSSTGYGTSVSAGTNYYYSTSPYLSKISFVPTSGYSGTLSLSYTGVSNSGTSFTGAIHITVGGSSLDSIEYTVAKGSSVTFDGEDFNTTCLNDTGDTLSYVKFTLPSSSYGTLYYNYTSPSDFDSYVSAATKLYYNGMPYLSNVTFVPYSGYSGSVPITYTGVSYYGYSFTGTVNVDVTSAASAIKYSTDSSGTAAFSSADFNSVCISATGSSLSYVTFAGPPVSSGTLYYNYTSPSNPGSAVTLGSRYYYTSTPALSYITFVSSGSFSGTVPLNYTALSQNGTSYSGTVYITVSGSVSAYFDDVTQNYVWAADAIDYLYKHSVVSGTDTDIFSPGSNIRRGDFVLMLVRAFSLTATDAKCSFTDVAKGSYYYDAIAISEKLGISQGSGGKFNPMATLTRQDAMVLVKRTLDVANIDIADGSESDLRGFTDNSSISAYARDAAADLVKAGVIIGTDNKLNPSGSITRAELAVILYRILSAF